MKQFFFENDILVRESFFQKEAFLCGTARLPRALGWFAFGYFYAAPVGLDSTAAEIEAEYVASPLRQLEQLAAVRLDGPKGWLVEDLVSVKCAAGYRLVAEGDDYSSVLAELESEIPYAKLLELKGDCVGQPFGVVLDRFSTVVFG